MPPRDKSHQRLSQRLKEMRQAAEVTVPDAVLELQSRGIRVGERYLRQWESTADPREPIASDLADIADVYGCTVLDFFAE